MQGGQSVKRVKQTNQFKYHRQAILMSIQPEWCELISQGIKTVEVRKSRPKMDPSFKVYIYCTLSGEAWLTKGEQPVQGNGKVIGEFICSKIDELKSNEVFNAREMYNQAHLTKAQFLRYADNKTVYLWHITKLTIYSEPRSLNKFYIKQAPQSWRYVTEYWRI